MLAQQPVISRFEGNRGSDAEVLVLTENNFFDQSGGVDAILIHPNWIDPGSSLMVANMGLLGSAVTLKAWTASSALRVTTIQ
jgi:hypothetical protein